MGLLLAALILYFVASVAVLAAIVHRRKELAKRDELIARKAARETVALTAKVIRGESPMPGR